MSNQKFPEPQANSLEKVAVVVNVIENGCTTSESIGEALGVSARQGAYYANAAGYLGLIESCNYSTHTGWAVSPAGEKFLKLSPAQKIETLGKIIAASDGIKAYMKDGEEGVKLLLKKSNLSGDTVERRFATITSWAEAISRPNQSAKTISNEITNAKKLSVDAVASLAKKIAESGKNSSKPVKVCSKCFMQLLPSGVCGTC